MQRFEASTSSFRLASEHQTVSSLSQLPILPLFFNRKNIKAGQHHGLSAHWLKESNTFNSDGLMLGFHSICQATQTYTSMCMSRPTHLFTMVSVPYFPLLLSFIVRGGCSWMQTLEQSPRLRVAGKWKLRPSQLWFQLHFLKVWCQKKKGKKRNLTRYNLADCSYARATNKLLSAAIVLRCGLHIHATPN